MDEAQVITVADHDGWVTYYVFPAEEEIVDLDDLFDKVEESDSVKEFRNPIDFAIASQTLN